MSRATDFWAVIPAAGSGQRLGGDKPKQYLTILGKTILEHSLIPFCRHPLIKGVAVAVAPGDQHWRRLEIANHNKIITAAGGKERCLSVLNALERIHRLAHEDDWVLVHDAARPCVMADDIDLLLSRVKDHAVGGILAMPLDDTLKKADANNHISSTIERRGLWRALTPQMFRLGLLRESMTHALANNIIVTDEAQAVENTHYKAEIVRAGAHNIKITHMEDLALAEFYLQNRRAPQ